MGYTEKAFVCNDVDTVVETTAGKVKGYRYDGVNTFLGIQYAEAERFMPPKPVKPWDGIRDTQGYGWTAPLLREKGPWSNIINPNRAYPESETCQFLNVWSPSLNSSAKLPVVVWIHGGGFESGSCVELTCYDGSNMAKHGQVVCVSLNHRLNVLGYLDLSGYGEKYANSGNAGMADIVAALEWIRDNIASFGGDPNCVTVFGQSGGGAKVSTLMQIPAADGLFHRAVVMSGASTQRELPDRDDRKIVDGLLKELNLREEDIDGLKKVPLNQLMSATDKVMNRLFSRKGGVLGSIYWKPVPNDWYKGEPSRVGFTEHAKTVPVMVGTVISEFNMRAMMHNKNHASEEERIDYLRPIFGGHTEELVSLFRKAYPGRNVAELAEVDHVFRPRTIQFADSRARDNCCGTYVYLNTFETNYDDGMLLWHCGDIDFFFHNAELSPLHQVPGITSGLQDQIFGAFMAFARTGDPNHPGLPEWPAYTKSDPCTLLFGQQTEVRRDHDRELVAKIGQWRLTDPPIDF